MRVENGVFIVDIVAIVFIAFMVSIVTIYFDILFNVALPKVMLSSSRV